jgi:hypothetical protein
MEATRERQRLLIEKKKSQQRIEKSREKRYGKNYTQDEWMGDVKSILGL